MSVLLFDREYRKLQASTGFQWGTDVQHFHTLFLQPRDKSAAQGNLPKKGMPNGQTAGKPNKDKTKEKPICRNLMLKRVAPFPAVVSIMCAYYLGAPRGTLPRPMS